MEENIIDSMHKQFLKTKISFYTKPDVLPFRATANNGKGLLAFRRLLCCDNVQMIQDLVTKTDDSGLPLILNVCNFGRALYYELLPVLTFYDQQVERLINYLGNNPCFDDLFYYEQEQKLEAVREHAKTICDYLFSREQDYIFGKLTDTQKKQIYLAIKGANSEIGIRLLNQITTIIANYTVLPELEKLDTVHKKQVLTRFIK